MRLRIVHPFVTEGLNYFREVEFNGDHYDSGLFLNGSSRVSSKKGR